MKLEVLECFYTFHVFSLVLWLDSTHCVLVVGVGHDLFLSTQLSRYCLVLMPLQWRCNYLNRPPTLSSNSFIAYDTLTMATLWLHVMWLVVGIIIFNPCVSLPPWKVAKCQWNKCDLFKSFKFFTKSLDVDSTKKPREVLDQSLSPPKVNKTHAYESK